jgi:D-glycero-alpha-D-manno-heptose-7-phosphate kinase
MVSKRDLARAAIHLEQERLRETVGCQDQIVAAYGGLNRIDFTTNGDFRVAPVMMSPDRLVALRQNLMLVFTGISRTASAIAAEQVRVTPHRLGPLKRIQEMVEEGTAQLGAGDLAPFGRLLHESWLLKRSLTPLVSTPEIDAVYDAARSAGALGGKLLGAGGGGFMLLFVPPDRRGDVGARLRGLLEVPFEFERAGSEVIFHG